VVKSAHAQRLQTRLHSLEASLVPGSSQGSASPVARKINEGSDRYGGYPPA